MAVKIYLCSRYPSYRVRGCKFCDGIFQTDDPVKQKFIEKADGFGSLIVEVDAMPMPVAKPSGARQGPTTAAQFVAEQDLGDEKLNRAVKEKREELLAVKDVHDKQRKKAAGKDAMTVIKAPEPKEE